jgi:hypothetical protein
VPRRIEFSLKQLPVSAPPAETGPSLHEFQNDAEYDAWFETVSALQNWRREVGLTDEKRKKRAEAERKRYAAMRDANPDRE